ncbi:MAG: glycoside hydrolase family 15 protein [Actinomycetota bacterium]|nr:glycoside hydrolase family 15 protein [Actinomycetota bacterium]
MSKPLEDYALIGDTQTAALVARDGSIDWLCLPRFDSGACFAALLGGRDHGRWLLEPVEGATRTTRRYLEDTLVLETEMETANGAVRVIDFMPPRQTQPDLVRVVKGVRGRVQMRMELVVRFDYGSIVPWVRQLEHSLSFVAGPDALELRTPIATEGRGLTTVAEFAVPAGESVPFVLTWHPSYESAPKPINALTAQADTASWWREWARSCRSNFASDDVVVRSLLTLKALTYAPTGGIVAAPTTSLPEDLGGVRNWDYRFCWLRDATFTLYALLMAGYDDEARAWRVWLLRAAAGQPSALQIMYGPAGERRLPERELPWLPGYAGSKPVRIGNAASAQLQLDVYGEVMDVMHQARRAGIAPTAPAWELQRALLEFLESGWREPDEGIWEVRGPRRHFTHSKVMAWVAMDRAVKAVERFGLDGPVERWRRYRQEIHDEVCDRGYDADRGAFTQYYGSKQLDASLLMVPLVGFLPPGDERVRGTVEAIEGELCRDGFVLRYLAGEESVDGLPGGEGAFLACSFWLADNLALLGRADEAGARFERLISVRNDVGLLAEEYDPEAGRMVGNFPQAFSHVALVNTARNLTQRGGPMQQREST